MAEFKDNSPGRGYWGRILNVDLAEGTLQYQDLPEEFYAKYLGGVGLAARILYDRIRPGIHPLGPENILGFVPGLLTDTGTLFSGRFLVTGLSPQTGGWGDANCGGYFSPALKRCRVGRDVHQRRGPGAGLPFPGRPGGQAGIGPGPVGGWT